MGLNVASVGDSLPAEPQGKPKNTGVGSLSLLQWFFLTQESNQGLLHCRRILYQLSYQGSHSVQFSSVQSLSRVRLCATPWTVAHQVPLSMGFSRQEYWSGVPFPFPGDLPDPGIEPGSPPLQADSLPSEPLGKPPLAHILLEIQTQCHTPNITVLNSLL